MKPFFLLVFFIGLHSNAGAQNNQLAEIVYQSIRHCTVGFSEKNILRLYIDENRSLNSTLVINDSCIIYDLNSKGSIQANNKNQVFYKVFPITLRDDTIIININRYSYSRKRAKEHFIYLSTHQFYYLYNAKEKSWKLTNETLVER